MNGPVHERVTIQDVWAFIAPAGWATQWYWPEGVHGKVWNFFHGRGWQVV
jgi:hypothetical protein